MTLLPSLSGGHSNGSLRRAPGTGGALARLSGGDSLGPGVPQLARVPSAGLLDLWHVPGRWREEGYSRAHRKVPLERSPGAQSARGSPQMKDCGWNAPSSGEGRSPAVLRAGPQLPSWR